MLVSALDCVSNISAVCGSMLQPTSNLTTTTTTLPPGTLAAAFNASVTAVQCQCFQYLVTCLSQQQCALTAVELAECAQQCPAAMCMATPTTAPTQARKNAASASLMSMVLAGVIVVIIAA
jgi:hypothetical protein